MEQEENKKEIAGEIFAILRREWKRLWEISEGT